MQAPNPDRPGGARRGRRVATCGDRFRRVPCLGMSPTCTLGPYSSPRPPSRGRPVMTPAQSADGADLADGSGPLGSADDLTQLQAIVRRVVGARVGSHPAAEDLVQETLTRVLA